MACCVVGLMLVYQLIDAWQRLRRFCGLPARAYGRVLAWHDGPRGRRWRPALLVSFAAFELGLGSMLIHQHRDHLQAGAHAVWHGTADVYQSMCRRVAPMLASSTGVHPDD